MNTRAENNVNFYESQKDMGVKAPYAVMSAQVLDSIIKRLVSWDSLPAAQPKLAEFFGDVNTAHLQRAACLRSAMHKSVRVGIFPNVLLSEQDFSSIMALIQGAGQVQPETAG